MLSNQRAFASFGAATLVAAAGSLLLAAYVSSGPRAPAPPAARTARYETASFTFSAPQALLHPPIPATPGLTLKDQDVEPEIKVDLFGNIYVTAIHGTPGGVDLWKSTDKGQTFTYLGEPDGAQDQCNVAGTLPCVGGVGGGDDSIDVSSGGYLYVSSLFGPGVGTTSITMSSSSDGGTGGTQPGQAWVVNPVSNTIPVDDRQWIAAFGPQTIYMTFDQAPANTTIWFTKSTDAGKTWSPPTSLIPLTTLSRENNVAVDRYNGNIYTTYTASGKENELHLLKSTDGGGTWKDVVAYTGPAGTCLENAFPIIAVDKGGNVHAVFTQSVGCGPTPQRTNAHVLLISSGDEGEHWTAPLQIDSGPQNNSTVMPWIVGGSSGVVDVTWYGSSIASPDAVPDPNDKSTWWNVFFAQVTDALGAKPTITQTVAVPAVHNDAICSRGGNCAGTTRDLAEYYTMTLDDDGNANIAYADEVNYCAAHPAGNCFGHTIYTKQISGPSAFAPPAGPPPATFAANVPMPGASPGTHGFGAEPSLKVDSHNCVYTAAPGNPNFWASYDNGQTFQPPVNPVADENGLTGGDEEILPFPPNASGPDPVYFADLGISSVHIRESTDRGKTWAAPGPAGAGGEVAISSDRQWLYGDHAPTDTDVTIYEMDHEFASEAIRFHALTNDTAWSPPADGMTSSELILPPDSTFPNTNPGPVFVDPKTHQVYGIFNASTITTNAAQPPFGKMPNVWEANGAGVAVAGAPPGPFTNVPVFKGVIDSPSTAPQAAQTFGNNASNDFPTAAIDRAGNIYVVWAMNDSRTNQFGIWFVSSHDHGQTFYGPFEVSKGSGAAVMPWIAAGDDGIVDIVYYATTANVNPNTVALKDPNVPWNVMFAQSVNATAREPAFTVSQASDHVNHYGVICNLGILCGSGTRSLLDFFNVAIGPDGLANIVYADDSSEAAHPVYARQNSGPLGLNAPTAPQCLAASTSPTPSSTASPSATGSPASTPTPTASSSPTATASPSATPTNVQLLNISGRARVDTGDNVNIAGFIITGERSKRVIVRALGPSLTVNGAPVPGRIDDPLLELRDGSGNLVAQNDNWRSDQEQEVTATGIPPSDDRESAIVLTLPPDNYTAVVRGVNGTSGVALAEVYDLSPTDGSELGNLSVRANVLTGDNALISGIILRGGVVQRVLFRGIGPSLSDKVSNALQDPEIELYDQNGMLLMQNDNWKDAPNAAEIQASGLAPSDDHESAILLPLPASNYTSVLRGVNDSTGIALDEAYKLSDTTAADRR